jgi:4a-hydroxytetrahydrobiopterin dehydratase
MPRLTDAEIEQRLATVSGWTRDAHLIRKQFTLPSFPDALAFLVRLGFDAEAADHHPDIVVDYKRVTLRYWTHSEGGITEKDFDGAANADRIAATFIR